MSCQVLGSGSLTRGTGRVRPNPSLEPTRYGRHRKAGLRYAVHSLSPALRCPPPLSAQLER